ncbi:MAG: Transcriptional regulator [Lachnospiraceae bacterium]|jgi:DNA-binding MurR/RpiR family transcriptional regulator|nr:Transcriptional regulator [Lachnospiraceae bacterium]
MKNDSIFEMITTAYPNLPQSEKKVADYVINNLPQVLRMTVQMLTKEVGVSEPTVFRFCNSLGFTGFKDFKISVAERMSNEDYFFSDINKDNFKTDIQELITSVLRSEEDTILATIKGIDYAKLNIAANMIIESNKICFFGAGSSGVICKDAMLKFIRLGKSVWGINDYHTACNLVSLFKPEDLVICITNTGNTKEPVSLLKIAKENGIPTISMTSSIQSKVCQYSDVVLRTFARESLYARTAMTSRIGQYAMIDALFLNVIQSMGAGSIDMLEKTKKTSNNLIFN